MVEKTPESVKTPSQGNPERGQPTSTGSTVSLILRFERFAWDLAGALLLTLAVLTFLSITGVTSGALIGPWAGLFKRWFGVGSYFVVFFMAMAGVYMLRRRRGSPEIPWGRVAALEIAGFAAMALLALLSGLSLDRAEAGQDGGLVGWSTAELARLLFTFYPAVLLMIVVLLWGIGSGLGWWRVAGRWLEKRLEQSGEQQVVNTEYMPDLGAAVSIAPVSSPEKTNTGETKKDGRKILARLPAQFRKNFRIEDQDERPAEPLVRDERLPPFELLLDEKIVRPDERNINITAGLIEKTLADFGIPAKVIGFQVGPTVTQFAVEPGYLEKGSSEEEQQRQKVRVAQISGLARDLALALSASRLRIEAPVPGKAYVGIEVPNSRSSVVRLRPILETETFQRLDSPLAIALGRDVSGRPVVTDLSKMPHLLIAGTTGSGKSVCIAALTACLVMNNTPEDLRIVMIDPKMVELVRFNGLPHLYGKVETDLQRILGVLHWTVVEMDRRYKLLEESRSRQIDSHNRKMRRRKGAEVLPRIVVLIDELADLMMAAPDQTEPSLIRLAQLARATGIHLVVATQRPSTEVVTGLIKANFPARLSFAVASNIDSRVILDTQGAEALLGKGDMLFMPPDAPSPIRAQGVMVTDQEIERIITFWQKQAAETGEYEPPWEELLKQQENLGDRDDLVQRAIELVKQSHRASTSLLQRRLKVGYPRAARLMDELEELGIVGPSLGGGKEREVLVSDEDDVE